MMAEGRAKFEDILQLAGEQGRWQMQVLVWTFLAGVICAMHNLSSVFIASVPDHHCSLPDGGRPEDWLPIDSSTGNFSQCLILAAPGSNISLPCSNYTYHMEDQATSIVSDWDLVCSRRWLASTVQASYMFGILCGALSTGVISDQFGRKRAVVGSGVAFVVSAVAATFANSYGLLVALRFVTAFANAGVFGCGFILYMELVGPQWRALLGLMYQIPFAVGFMLLPAVAYSLKQWRHVQLAISVPAVLMLSFWWVLPESPRWLTTKGRLEEALAVLKSAAARNRRQLPPDQQLMKMMAEFRAEEVDGGGAEQRPALATCADGVCEMTKLIRTPKLRCISLVSFYNWLVVSMIYYGVSVNTASLSSSPYLAIFLGGLVEAPAVLVTVPLINRFGRRVITVITHLITGLAILCILAVPADEAWPKLLLGTLGKFSSSATFGLLYVYSAEYFPTQLRNAGLGASSTFARVGSTVAPYVVDLLTPVHWSIPSCVFGVFAVTAALTALSLPETVGCRLLETVDDVEEGRWEMARPADLDEPSTNGAPESKC